MKICQNDEQTQNLAATLFQYVMQTYHKKLIQKLGSNTENNCIVFPYVVRT